MNVSFYIAGRYLRSKKSHNAINIISMVSGLGVAIGSFALIVVLSVFNGFEQLVISLYNSFDPQLKITPYAGKHLDLNNQKIAELKNTEGLAFFVPVMEENALVKYKDQQYLVMVKGVGAGFREMSHFDNVITEGSFKHDNLDINFAVFGQGVVYNLSLALNDIVNPVQLYFPKRDESQQLDPENSFVNLPIYPSGVFAIQQEFDSKYIITNLEMVQRSLELPGKATAIEMGFKPGIAVDQVKKQLKDKLGEAYVIKDRYEQHELLYKIMKTEKWAVFLILSFILVVASFNVIGSLTMLIIEKKKDISILSALGADASLIRKIFLVEGMLVSLIGAAIGLFSGFLLCYLQMHYGLVKLGGTGTFVIEAYPVAMVGIDFVYVFLTIIVIGFLAAWIPSRQIVSNNQLSIR